MRPAGRKVEDVHALASEAGLFGFRNEVHRRPAGARSLIGAHIRVVAAGGLCAWYQLGKGLLKHV